MNLVDKQVTHKVFGNGRVVQYDDFYILIDFPTGNKKFVFPDAFETYLTLIDQKAAGFVNKLVQEKNKKRAERDEKLRKLEALQYEKQQRLLEDERVAQKRKINPRSQSVFWCKPDELSRVFSEWSVFTGTIKSGQRKGEPNHLAQIKQNSACLLTARDAEMPENNRYILGVFMVSENYNATQYTDGYIPAHSKYRLRLSEQESKKMLFWNYYINKRYPHRMTWNTGRHRYFDNKWMAQILKDIVSLKNVPQEQEHIQSFLKYFCHLNRIDLNKLPEPDGALLRV